MNTSNAIAKGKTVAACAYGALALGVFLLGVAVGRYEWIPINRAVELIKGAQKQVAVRLAGEDEYVRTKLAEQFVRTSADASVRAIDTSRLPLVLNVKPLGGVGQFPSGGGAIANVAGRLLVLDRLGNIFLYKEGAIEKLEYGELPNNLREFIKHSKYPLRSDTLRTHYIAYDSDRSTIYVSFQRFNTATNAPRFCIAAIPVDRQTLKKTGEWRVIFESEDFRGQYFAGTAAGGRLAVAGGILYFAVGDYGTGGVPLESEVYSQDLKSSFGKIYQYDIANARVSLKSLGHRNPQGLVVTSTGDVIAAEHGPEGGDELNLIKDGNNYGWPFRTYGTKYGTYSWPIKLKEPDVTFSEPLFSWVPSVAIAPLIQVANFHASWDGDLLAGSLKAQSLFRIRLVDSRVAFSEPIWIGHRIRDIAQWQDSLVLMVDDPALIFVNIDRARLVANTRAQTLIELNAKLASCRGCHHWGVTNPSHLAPSLASLVGRGIGTDNFRGYSPALTSKGGRWNKESLARFLRDPNEFAKGSTMPRPNLSEAEISEVVALLTGAS